MAKELGAALARTDEYQAYRRVLEASADDRELVEMRNRLEAIEARIETALRAGKEPDDEVKAAYTEDARKRGVTGEVVLEIVVRRDGTVGDVTVRRGIGAGLDERAVAAVRQWRFAPARRQGEPVDVVVEVAVDFTLR